MFKAVGRLLNNSDEQDKYARTLFKLCCDDGYLGEMAFMRMKAAVSNVVYKELTGGKMYEELPEEWKRNVTKRQKKYDMRKNLAKKGTIISFVLDFVAVKCVENIGKNPLDEMRSDVDYCDKCKKERLIIVLSYTQVFFTLLFIYAGEFITIVDHSVLRPCLRHLRPSSLPLHGWHQ